MKYIKNRNEMLTLLPKKIVVAELGVFRGDYSQIIIDIIQPSYIYLVDIFNDGPFFSGDKDGENAVTIPNLFIEYENLVKKYEHHNNVSIIRNTTTNFLLNINSDLLQAVYIDADHSYDSVYNDLINSYNKVKQYGWIMGHDFNSGEVQQAVNRFCNEKNLEIEYLTEDKCPSFIIIKK